MQFATKTKKRNIEGLDESIITDNPYEVVNDPEIQIVAELVGGTDPAFDLIKTAIKNGKHIVTANKELLAKTRRRVIQICRRNNKVVLYEAAIAGGIPLIMPIKTILAGNKINKIKAILNGTTNYIFNKNGCSRCILRRCIEKNRRNLVMPKLTRQVMLKVLTQHTRLQPLQQLLLANVSNLKMYIVKELQKSVLTT